MNDEEIKDIQHKRDIESLQFSHYMKNSKSLLRIIRLKKIIFNRSMVRRAQRLNINKEELEQARKKRNQEVEKKGSFRQIFNLCFDEYKHNALYRTTLRQSLVRGSINGINGLLQQGMMICLNGAVAHSLPLFGKISDSAAKLTAFVGLAIPSIRGALGDMANTSYNIKAENLRNRIKSDTQFDKIKKLWEKYPMLFVKGNNHEVLKATIQTLAQEKAKILSSSSFFVGGLCSFALAAGVIAYNNPTIAAISMGISAASGYVFSKTMRFFDKSAQKLINKSTQYAGVMGDVMQHLGLVKQNNISDNIDKKFSRDHQHELERTNALSKQRSKLVLRLQLGLYAAVGIATAFYASGHCQTPESAAMALGITTSALTTLFGAIGVVNSSSNLQAALTSYNAMSEKLKIPETMKIKEGKDKIPYQERYNEIVAKDIRFSYPNLSGEQATIKSGDLKEQADMNIHELHFQSGKLQCVVGKSGNGKSTLINLLTHTYDVNQGEVLINGVNVQDTNQRDLMEHICWQDQNSNFFETYTVRENMEVFIPSLEKINWAKEQYEQGLMDEKTYKHLEKLYEHPQEMIDEALKKAHVYDEYYTLRDGKPTYDTKYDQLSKGQQQRLALARAFLSDRDIYIFDEPTDSLDPISTQQITNTFKEMAKEGKNVIVITHAPQIMAQADQITVIDNMQVVGNGKPEDVRKNTDYLRDVFPRESDIYAYQLEAARSVEDKKAEFLARTAFSTAKFAETTTETITLCLDKKNDKAASLYMEEFIHKIKELSDIKHQDIKEETPTYVKIAQLISEDKKLYDLYLRTAQALDDTVSSNDTKSKIEAFKEQARKDGVKETLETREEKASVQLRNFILQQRS